jgi:hypothetical protein
MAMPETPMHKNCELIGGEHYIWLARKIFSMKPESVPHSMQIPTNSHFRLRVLPFDASHHF